MRAGAVQGPWRTRKVSGDFFYTLFIFFGIEHDIMTSDPCCPRTSTGSEPFHAWRRHCQPTERSTSLPRRTLRRSLHMASNACRARQGARGQLGLNDLGKLHGCHTCGTRREASYIGDHMPPNNMVQAGQPQRLFPQCATCSSLQGAQVLPILPGDDFMLAGAAVKSRRPVLITHATSLRWHHLWLPLGPALWPLLT